MAMYMCGSAGSVYGREDNVYIRLFICVHVFTGSYFSHVILKPI